MTQEEIRARLHPSLRESFIPIEADAAHLLPGDVASAVRDILASRKHLADDTKQPQRTTREETDET